MEDQDREESVSFQKHFSSKSSATKEVTVSALEPDPDLRDLDLEAQEPTSGSKIFGNKKEYEAVKKHFSSKSSSASQQKPDSRGKYSCDEEAGDKDDYKVPEQMEAARDRDSEYSVFPLLDEELESVFSRA